MWKGRGAYRGDGNAVAGLDLDGGAIRCGEGVGSRGLVVKLGGAREAHALERVSQEQGVGLLRRRLGGEGPDCLYVGRTLG